MDFVGQFNAVVFSAQDVEVVRGEPTLRRRFLDLEISQISPSYCHALAYYHESQERKLKEAQLVTRLIEARLKTLEAELHPLILVNTLHAISTLVHRDPESADRMISRD